MGSGEPATIAKWDGKQWSVLGSATNESNGVFNFVNALVVSGGNLYAGGEFTTVGGISATNIAKWNGGSWSALSAGLSGNIPGYAPVTALAVSGSDVYAGGSFTNAGGIAVESIAKWNGSSWSALGSGEHPKVVYALAVSGNHLYAGGRFGTIAKWNGSTWSELGSGMEGWGVSALAVSGDDVYAGGNFTTAGGLTANSIAR